MVSKAKVKMTAEAKFRHAGRDLKRGDFFETDEENALDLICMAFATRRSMTTEPAVIEPDLNTIAPPRRTYSNRAYRSSARTGVRYTTKRKDAK